MKFVKLLLKKKILFVPLFALLLCTVSGCQLFVLPFYVVAQTMQLLQQILTFAVTLPFRLLPLAIKYAPLALLFLERDSGAESFYIERFSASGAPWKLEHFVDETGREISVFSGTSTLFTEPAFPFSSGRLILTPPEQKRPDQEELQALWKVIQNKTDRFWVTGASVKSLENNEIHFWI